jgi:quercetin dioxygenase-like cupin family protein
MTSAATTPREPLVRLGGSSVFLHLAGEDTGGASALMEFHVQPGYPVPPPHVHTHEDEISYVLDGEIEVTVGSESRIVRTGEAIFKPRGVAHAFALAGDAPARFLEVIAPAGFEGYFRAVAAMVRETGELDREAAGRLMAEYGLRPA